MSYLYISWKDKPSSLGTWFQVQIDTDCHGMYVKMNLLLLQSEIWMSIEETVNPCLEYLILYYQFPCFDPHICCLLQIFQSLWLADINKAVKYERPGDCLVQDMRSFNERIAFPWQHRISNSLYIVEISKKKVLILKGPVSEQPLCILNNHRIPKEKSYDPIL